MVETTITNEFSICLVADEINTEKINATRSKLPESPYRDDPPHVTLLRGVTTPADVSSNRLVKDISALLDLDIALPMEVRIREVTNMRNRFYGVSGVVILDPSSLLMNLRKRAVRQLIKSIYTIEEQEVETYTPHMTIRLGVQLEGSSMDKAKKAFPLDEYVTFNKWILLRLVKEGEKRVVQELSV